MAAAYRAYVAEAGVADKMVKIEDAFTEHLLKAMSTRRRVYLDGRQPTRIGLTMLYGVSESKEEMMEELGETDA